MALKPPLSLITRLDTLRALRELEDFENGMSESRVRGHHIPELTPLLKDISDLNSVDPHKKEVRLLIKHLLEELRTSAPIVHISFAVEPDIEVLTKIVAWFRQNIDPNIVLHVGVQPSIGVGCVVRTTNKNFDFSIRKHLVAKSELFKKQLEGVV